MCDLADRPTDRGDVRCSFSPAAAAAAVTPVTVVVERAVTALWRARARAAAAEDTQKTVAQPRTSTPPPVVKAVETK